MTPLDITPRFRRRDVRTDDAARQTAAPLPHAPTPAAAPIASLVALVHAIPPLRGPRGRPRCRPDCVRGDRAYDAEKIRAGLRAKGIQPLLAQRNTWHGSGLGNGGGLWSGRLRGSTSSAGCGSAMKSVPTSMRPSWFSVVF